MRSPCSSKKGDHAVVQQLGRGQRGLAVVELGETHLRVGVDGGLLVDTAYPLQGADVEGVLRDAIAGVLAFELAVGLLVGLGLLQRDKLGLGQHAALLRHLRLERLQPVLHRGQVVPQPDVAHAEGRDLDAALAQLVGHPRA